MLLNPIGQTHPNPTQFNGYLRTQTRYKRRKDRYDKTKSGPMSASESSNKLHGTGTCNVFLLLSHELPHAQTEYAPRKAGRSPLSLTSMDTSIAEIVRQQHPLPPHPVFSLCSPNHPRLERARLVSVKTALLVSAASAVEAIPPTFCQALNGDGACGEASVYLIKTTSLCTPLCHCSSGGDR